MAARLAPKLRAVASADARMVGHFDDSDVVLDFLAREKLDALARARHLVSRPLPAHEDQAARRRRSRDATSDLGCAVTRAVPRRLPRLLRAARIAGLTADAGRRSRDHPRAGRRHVLVRQGQADGTRRRRVLRQRHQRDARRRVGVDLCTRSHEREKFRIEYWALEEAKLQRLPKPKRHAGRIALVTGGGQRHRQGHRRTARRRRCVRRGRRPRRRTASSEACPITVVAVQTRRDRRGICPRRGRHRTPGFRWRRPRRQQRRACRSPSRCSRRPSATGISSTT